MTDLGSVSFSENGKRATVYEGCTLPVCELLTDKVDQVLDAVTLSLCSFTQLKLAKSEVKFQLSQFNKFIDDRVIIYSLSYRSFSKKGHLYKT